jgi:ribosomal protein S27E
MDHQPEADERWLRLTALGCPLCGHQVLTTDLPSINVWCAVCPSTPRLERTAT